MILSGLLKKKKVEPIVRLGVRVVPPLTPTDYRTAEQKAADQSRLDEALGLTRRG